MYKHEVATNVFFYNHKRDTMIVVMNYNNTKLI